MSVSQRQLYVMAAVGFIAVIADIICSSILPICIILALITLILVLDWNLQTNIWRCNSSRFLTKIRRRSKRSNKLSPIAKLKTKGWDFIIYIFHRKLETVYHLIMFFNDIAGQQWEKYYSKNLFGNIVCLLYSVILTSLTLLWGQCLHFPKILLLCIIIFMTFSAIKFFLSFCSFRNQLPVSIMRLRCGRRG